VIDQLSVFLENTTGRLESLCRAIGDAGINMHTLVVADTEEFGIVRILCDEPARAKALLEAEGYGVRVTPVLAVEVPSVPGAAADIFGALDRAGLSVEYAYCFEVSSGSAIDVFKTDASAEEALRSAGYRVLSASELYSSSSSA